MCQGGGRADAQQASSELEPSYSSVNGPPAAEQQAAISINLDVTRSRLTMRLTARVLQCDLQCDGSPANAQCMCEQQDVLVWDQHWMNLIWLLGLGSVLLEVLGCCCC